MVGIEYPITVDAVEFEKSDTVRPPLFGAQSGDFVSIRPCGDEYAGKTYLGVMIGDIARTQMASYKRETKTLSVSMALYNPAIFVPDLKKVIFGCESWWGKIEDETSLRQISDSDIDSVWYVQALKSLSEEQPSNCDS